MEIEGTNFKCPDTKCADLRIRFGEGFNQILVKGEWISDSKIKVKIPKYTKPDVLRVELTLNGIDYTGDKKQYGYFDPYVLNAEPRLISVEGSTVLKIKGFGFVNSGESKALFNGTGDKRLVCNN